MKKVRVTERRNRSRCVGAWAFARPEWLLVLSLVFLALVGTASAGEPTTAKNVLVLYSFSDRSAFGPTDSLESAIRARVPWPVNFYVEYLEGRHFEQDAAYEKSLVETLQYTYGREKFDLVMVAAYPALQFAVRHRDQLFPGVPIVFMEVVAGRLTGQKMWPGVTGVTEALDVRGTIDLALRLHPKTNTVVVITDTSPWEKYWLGVVHAELLRHQEQVREIDLVGVRSDQLLERVDALPLDTVILFQEAPQGSIQSAIGPYEALELIGKRRPTYCIFAVLCLNHGGIGGSETSAAEEIRLAADLAERVLSGERPDDIAVVNGPLQVRMDWRQLRRWHIPESALPPGSQVLYREPTLWERDRKYVIAAVVVILAQALLIIGLLWQRARKRKAEAVLRESEKRFQMMADTTPALIWMADQEGKVTYLNSKRVEFTGRDPDSGYGDTWTTFIHPDDVDSVVAANSGALVRRESFSKEYRLRRRDGEYRWMFDVASPRVNGDGSFAGFIGSAIDITDQKVAQEALENVGGRLIQAQEKERSRIARDLHDDICQRLALVSVELAQVNRNGTPPDTKLRLEEIRQYCSEIAGDVQALSHQLHSSKLEYLGIVAAIKGFCKEFSKQQDVRIAFKDQDVPRHLPKDISLCLFRVTQEALHNALKYSGMRQFAVELSGTADKVQLVVSDEGAGFDVEAAQRERGLGLVSMQERVHLVQGWFYVQSKPGAGTKVVATVPIGAEIGGFAADAGGDQAASGTGAA